MPPRGSPSLWPVRILTDFGKDAYVLSVLAAMLLFVVLVAAAMRGTPRAQWLGWGLRLQFVFFAVLTPLFAGELIKWVVGRGRPFVGGQANPFNFAPFAGTEAHASFPSAHVITAAALAFAVSAVWPRARGAMVVYVLLIAATRLVLLAHHPSDVVAGALIGVVGAMAVRYWFAARRLGFAIHRNGEIVPLRSLSGHRKGLPARPRPHKKRTLKPPEGRRRRWMAHSNGERGFASFRHSRGGRFHRRSRAQRGREHQPADRRNRHRPGRPMGI
jgi:undecaprenyl-diphosphatase